MLDCKHRLGGFAMTTAELEETQEVVGFDDEPTMTRHSFLLGEVCLYAPDAPASEWGKLPWLFTTGRGWEGYNTVGLKHVIAPEHIMHAFHHPALIDDRHLWAG